MCYIHEMKAPDELFNAKREHMNSYKTILRANKAHVHLHNLQLTLFIQ